MLSTTEYYWQYYHIWLCGQDWQEFIQLYTRLDSIPNIKDGTKMVHVTVQIRGYLGTFTKMLSWYETTGLRRKKVKITVSPLNKYNV